MYPAAADKNRLVCETCELAKRTRSSYIYSGRSSRSSVPYYNPQGEEKQAYHPNSISSRKKNMTPDSSSSKHTSAPTDGNAL